MLNLLPPNLKLSYQYARLNRHLVHWITACALGILGTGLITAFGCLYLITTADNYRHQIATTNQQLSSQNYKKTQSQVKEMSNNLNLAVQVLSKQILFSGLLQQLTTLMPSNTNLTGLSISQTQGAIDISAAAKTYAAATQVQVNLADPSNKLFSKADIVSIDCTSTSNYPCTVVLRALFSQNNPYMLANTK